MSDLNCSICLENLLSKPSLVLLHCSHIFHQSCIEELLKFNKKCPNCRQKIEYSKIPQELFQNTLFNDNPGLPDLVADRLIPDLIVHQQIPDTTQQQHKPPPSVPHHQHALAIRDLLSKTTQIEELSLEIQQLQYQLDDTESVSQEDYDHLQGRYTGLLESNQALRENLEKLVKTVKSLQDIVMSHFYPRINKKIKQ
jgi:chromosome segregation ATPase